MAKTKSLLSGEKMLAQFQPGVTLKLKVTQKDDLSDEHRPYDYLTVVERRGPEFVGRLLHKAQLHPKMTSFVAIQDPANPERIYIIIKGQRLRIFEGIATEDDMRAQVRRQIALDKQRNGNLAAQTELSRRFLRTFKEQYAQYI